MSEASGEQRARQLLSEVPLLDGHNDLPWALRDAGCAGLDGTDLSQPVSFTQTDLPRLAAGGVGGQFWSVYVPTTLAGEAAVAATLDTGRGQHPAGHARGRRGGPGTGWAAAAVHGPDRGPGRPLTR